MTDFTNIKAVIFDYGGTLDTDARHWSHVLWAAYERAGIPVGEEQFREAYVSAERALAREPVVRPADTFRDVLLKKVALELHDLSRRGCLAGNEERVGGWTEAVVQHSLDYIAPILDVSRKVLAQLREHYKLVLVSNFYGNIGAILADFRLTFFDRVVESAVVGVRKPDPAIYRLGVEATGCSPADVLVVGDSYGKDIVPARQVGCRTVWLKGKGWREETVDESLPDAVITSLPQLLDLLPVA